MSDVHDVIDNLKLTLLGIALSWTLAAFGEELVYRGYLMNRLPISAAGRDAPGCGVLPLPASSSELLTHQGPTGMFEEGIAGAALAAMYLLAGRNMWIPIISHGAADSLDMILIYFGKYLGL